MNTLPDLEAEVKAGDTIPCPFCFGEHRLEPGPSGLLLYYRCNGDLHLGADSGKAVFNPSLVRIDIDTNRRPVGQVY